MHTKSVERNGSRRAAAWLALIGAASLACGFPSGDSATGPADPAGRPKKPNIVFFYTDDQDADQYSYTGGAAYTPAIDSLAHDGIFFSRFYISSPVCTPSRFSSLTGQYASRSAAVCAEYPLPGPSCLTWNAELQPGERTFAHVLKDAGYATGIVGKWMCGSPEDLIPVSRDDDPLDPEVLAQMRTNYDRVCAWIRDQYGFDYAERIYRNNLPGIEIPREFHRHNMEWITEGALEFIDANAERPFCLYLATTVPHSPGNALDGDPLLTPAGWLEKAPTVQPSRRNVLERTAIAGLPREAAVYTLIDDSLRAVLNKLDELGIADNTLVLFAPDHAKHGKYTCYGGHVPLFARWPDRISPGLVCDELTSNIDLAPTFFDVAGVEVPANMPLDGQSLSPLFQGHFAPLRDSLLLEIGYTKAVVTKEWKYVALRYPNKLQRIVDAAEPKTYMQDGSTKRRARGPRSFPAYWAYDQLYDFRSDPDDQCNLAGLPDCDAKLNELHERLSDHLTSFPNPFGEFHPRDKGATPGSWCRR